MGAAGADFEVRPAGVEELREGEPAEVVVANATRKAEAVAAKEPWAVVVGVDTDVALDGRLLGKADDAGAARERLRQLSGREHEVLSGIAVCRRGAPVATALARTAVRFRDLDSDTVERYVESGEWADRAGAYAVQGLGSMLVDRVDGDLSNVIGLPLPLLAEILPEAFEK